MPQNSCHLHIRWKGDLVMKDRRLFEPCKLPSLRCYNRNISSRDQTYRAVRDARPLSKPRCQYPLCLRKLCAMSMCYQCSSPSLSSMNIQLKVLLSRNDSKVCLRRDRLQRRSIRSQCLRVAAPPCQVLTWD